MIIIIINYSESNYSYCVVLILLLFIVALQTNNNTLRVVIHELNKQLCPLLLLFQDASHRILCQDSRGEQPIQSVLVNRRTKAAAEETDEDAEGRRFIN